MNSTRGLWVFYYLSRGPFFWIYQESAETSEGASGAWSMKYILVAISRLWSCNFMQGKKFINLTYQCWSYVSVSSSSLQPSHWAVRQEFVLLCLLHLRVVSFIHQSARAVWVLYLHYRALVFWSINQSQRSGLSLFFVQFELNNIIPNTYEKRF